MASAQRPKAWTFPIVITEHAYDKLIAVDRPEGPWQLVHCWTHVRRRFVKRLESDGSPIAEQALRQIAALYAIEASVVEEPGEARPETERVADVLGEL